MSKMVTAGVVVGRLKFTMLGYQPLDIEINSELKAIGIICNW